MLIQNIVQKTHIMLIQNIVQKTPLGPMGNFILKVSISKSRQKQTKSWTKHTKNIKTKNLINCFSHNITLIPELSFLVSEIFLVWFSKGIKVASLLFPLQVSQG